MHALPPAPAAPPRRQVLVGTAVASVAAVMLMGGMLGVFILQRERLPDGELWVPQGVTIPGVPTNVMLITFGALALFAQWAVHAARRRDRMHLGLALGLVAVLGLAIINAQVYVYSRMNMPVAETAYAGMFYAITGVMVVLVAVGVMFCGITAFRVLGGRDSDQEIVAAHALYWYAISAAFAALWLIVFVTK